MTGGAVAVAEATSWHQAGSRAVTSTSMRCLRRNEAGVGLRTICLNNHSCAAHVQVTHTPPGVLH